MINDSQTLSHLLRRLACGNLKLVQNWYKRAVQNVQNIKVTIVKYANAMLCGHRVNEIPMVGIDAIAFFEGGAMPHSRPEPPKM